MKYYTNLIKNKKYGTLICCLILAIIGLFCIFHSIIDVIENNIAEGNTSAYSIFSNGIIGLISATNVGMIFIGLFIVYIGLIWIPMNVPASQDDNDYTVTFDNDNIYIKFKDYEFCVKKETFQPTDLFFRDKNNKFVTSLRGYQIYNYVFNKYYKEIEKHVDNEKVIFKSEVVDKFSNVKVLSLDEKQKYINENKIKNRPRVLFIILSIMLWYNFIFWIFGFILIITGNLSFSIFNIIIAILMIIFSYILGKKSNKAINKNKTLIKKIMNKNMYDVECFIFDKRCCDTQDTDGHSSKCYEIKITDGNYIVNEWIEVDKTIYETNVDEKLHILVLDEKASDIFEIKNMIF